ncbi:MAG: DUF1801 domain-containing protein [Sphingobium sp.]|jgi:hypothetical protein|uniref:DUF1801 domain-containing protein n=1 Tax=Sphingomonadales TaxID=204457 RepID=UPI0009D90984|nr:MULTISPECIES: DUF1801 domain-containing protein [unclassified Novosphingobium]SMC30348.1 hypothetical protein SAMN06272759_10113 [Novosphingobium sp. B1]
MSVLFQNIFAELRAIMLEAAPGMTVAEDSPSNLTLKTHWIEARTGQPAWFGWIAIKKSYVAYHIMPLYTLPALEAAVPEGLATRRQGKTCFNVKKTDDAVFAQLRELTALAARMEPDLRAAIGA